MRPSTASRLLSVRDVMCAVHFQSERSNHATSWLMTMAQTCASPLPSRAESIAPRMERIMLNEAKALVLRNHDEVWSQGNIDAVDEIFAPDFVGHHPGQSDWVGADAVKKAVVNARAAFSRFRRTRRGRHRGGRSCRHPVYSIRHAFGSLSRPGADRPEHANGGNGPLSNCWQPHSREMGTDGSPRHA